MTAMFIIYRIFLYFNIKNWEITKSRDAVAARRQVFKKIWMLKSATTSSLPEYIDSESFDSDISLIKGAYPPERQKKWKIQ